MKMIDAQTRRFIGPGSAIVKKQKQTIVAESKRGIPVWLAQQRIHLGLFTDLGSSCSGWHRIGPDDPEPSYEGRGRQSGIHKRRAGQTVSCGPNRWGVPQEMRCATRERSAGSPRHTHESVQQAFRAGPGYSCAARTPKR